MVWRIVVFLAVLLFSNAVYGSVSGYGASVQGFSDYNFPAVNAVDCSSGGANSKTAGCTSTDVSGSADLYSGVIGTLAECCSDPLHTTGQSEADASYWDTITINLPNGFAGSTIPLVQFHFYVTGAQLTGAGTVSNAAYINATLSVIPDFTAFYARSDHGCISNDVPDFCPGLPNDLDLTVSYSNLIPVSNPKLQVRVDLRSWARGMGASADALDPGFVDVILPEGFSFTSESGALLTGSPVPEPATMVLVVPLGLAFLIGQRKRRAIALRRAPIKGD